MEQPIQTLNELLQKRGKTIEVSTKTKTIVSATISIEGGKRYKGKGETAIEAKNNAAENALEDMYKL